MIARLAKGVLPANTQIHKDALLALHKSATVFVSYIAAKYGSMIEFPMHLSPVTNFIALPLLCIAKLTLCVVRARMLKRVARKQ